MTSTVRAVLADTAEVFGAPGAVFTATLRIDADAQVPGGVAVLTPGQAVDAVVRIAPTRRGVCARSICVKLTNVYGRGRDQDFLLASSFDGIPGHHAVVHRGSAEGVYSSLWLYVAGVTPTVFGIRAPAPSTSQGGYAPGDRLEFLIATAVSRFHRVGDVELGEHREDAITAGVVFDAAHSGGGLITLPPVSRYAST